MTFAATRPIDTPQRSNPPPLVQVVGANRGGRMVMSSIIEAHEKTPIRFSVVDAKDGRAQALATSAWKAGIPSVAITGRAEEVLPAQNPTLPDVHISVMDDPGATAAGITTMLDRPAAILGYSFVRDSRRRLYGISMAIPGDALENKERGALFYRTLSGLWTRGGYDEVWGADVAGADALTIEPLFREAYRRHAGRNLAAMLARTELPSYPFELTTNNRTMPFIIVDSRVRWQEPRTLARRVVDVASVVFERRTGWFGVGEIGPDQRIRLHTAQLRPTDDELDVVDTTVLDTTQALLDAERREWSRQRGVGVSD